MVGGSIVLKRASCLEVREVVGETGPTRPLISMSVIHGAVAASRPDQSRLVLHRQHGIQRRDFRRTR
jgi:hypothetical protein